MFDVGFGEILLIMVISLVVLGPEKLPKLAADIGRWLGRARAMARQLSTQLEQEVRLEEMMREQKRTASIAPPEVLPAAQSAPPAAQTTPPAAATASDTPAAPVTTVLPNPPAVGPGAGQPSDEPHQHGPAAAAPASGRTDGQP